MKAVNVVCRTYRVGKAAKMKVEVLPGQQFDGWLVECPAILNGGVSDGQHLVLQAITARKRTGRYYLCSHPSHPWERVTEAQAHDMIRFGATAADK